MPVLTLLAFLVWLRTATEDRLAELEMAPQPAVMAVEAPESSKTQEDGAVLAGSDRRELTYHQTARSSSDPGRDGPPCL